MIAQQPWQRPIIRPALDLTKYAFRQQHGDITVFGTWWLDEDDGWVPCLALVPTFRMGHDGYMPAVVPMDHAWAWSEESGDPRYAAVTSAKFAAGLGFPVDHFSCFRIASIIREHLEDSIKRIPPRPTDHQSVAADVLLIDKSTGRERHAEIKDD